MLLTPHLRLLEATSVISLLMLLHLHLLRLLLLSELRR